MDYSCSNLQVGEGIIDTDTYYIVNVFASGINMLSICFLFISARTLLKVDTNSQLKNIAFPIELSSLTYISSRT